MQTDFQPETQSRNSQNQGPQSLQDAYLQYLLTQGRPPVSVFAFAQSQGITENEFYQQYNSFLSLEQNIWKDLFDATAQRLQADETYKRYSAREKVLALFFTWIEMLRPKRSYTLFTLKKASLRRMLMGASANTPADGPMPMGKVFALLRPAFDRFVGQIVNEGFDRGELVARPLVSDKYTDALYFQFMSVTRYWADDPSQNFEDTDAFIEKSVRLGFELMGPNLTDAGMDLIRFLMGRRR